MALKRSPPRIRTLLPGLHREFIARCIHPDDLKNTDIAADHCDAQELARRAETVLRYGFANITIDPISIRGNIAHCVRSTPHAVVLRSLNRILREATRAKPTDRDLIIRRLQTILREGVQHRVYKFDIKSFFESLDPEKLLNSISLLPQMPRDALFVLRNYFSELKDRKISGLPRGVQLSATLSEFALQQFDREVSLLPEVYFHARYVDDIIIITGARENSKRFARMVSGLLPKNLTMNVQKSREIDLPIHSQSTLIGEFDYLGYSFSIHPPQRGAQAAPNSKTSTVLNGEAVPVEAQR
jgi:hypothetical protein